VHRLAVTPEPSTIATEMPRSWTGVTAALFGMSPASSVGLIAHLRSHQPELPILAILETPTPSEWRRVLLAGASGAIALSAEPARLAEAISLSLRGFVLLEPSILANQLLGDSAPSPLDPNETRILRMMSEGITIQSAADQLDYSDRHLRRIPSTTSSGSLTALPP
jgi:DNA-binding NarL/FixJ family response regulator